MTWNRPCSPQLLIGLLAIIKAGGAYVPLDPDYPADRLDNGWVKREYGARSQRLSAARAGVWNW